MREKHLTYFKVENFKRFGSLELTDIGQFNLIVGDNNVGKTSVLEALLFDTDRLKCLSQLHKTLCIKGLHIHPKKTYSEKGEISIDEPTENFLHYLLKKSENPLIFSAEYVNENKETISIKTFRMFQSPNGLSESQIEQDRFMFRDYANSLPFSVIKFAAKSAREEMPEASIGSVYKHFFENDLHNLAIPLVAVKVPNDDYLTNLYSESIGISRKAPKLLAESIQKTILGDMEEVDMRKINNFDQIMIGQTGRDELLPMSSFGESVSRAVYILLEIMKNSNCRRLMIDEIDMGIHHTRIKSFFKTILQLAIKNDVQLFMTTHRLECQEAFAEVFEELDMVQYQGLARQFSLIEKGDGTVVANVHTYEQLQYALEIGFDTRGGKRGW